MEIFKKSYKGFFNVCFALVIILIIVVVTEMLFHMIWSGFINKTFDPNTIFSESYYFSPNSFWTYTITEKLNLDKKLLLCKGSLGSMDFLSHQFALAYKILCLVITEWSFSVVYFFSMRRVSLWSLNPTKIQNLILYIPLYFKISSKLYGFFKKKKIDNIIKSHERLMLLNYYNTAIYWTDIVALGLLFSLGFPIWGRLFGPTLLSNNAFFIGGELLIYGGFMGYLIYGYSCIRYLIYWILYEMEPVNKIGSTYSSLKSYIDWGSFHKVMKKYEFMYEKPLAKNRIEEILQELILEEKCLKILKNDSPSAKDQVNRIGPKFLVSKDLTIEILGFLLDLFYVFTIGLIIDTGYFLSSYVPMFWALTRVGVEVPFNISSVVKTLKLSIKQFLTWEQLLGILHLDGIATSASPVLTWRRWFKKSSTSYTGHFLPFYFWYNNSLRTFIIILIMLVIKILISDLFYSMIKRILLINKIKNGDETSEYTYEGLIRELKLFLKYVKNELFLKAFF